MNPPKFAGSLNPLLAHDWLTGMKQFFHVTPCNEEKKLTFVTHMLRGLVAKWWTIASARMTIQSIPNNREHFKTIFLDKYFLGSLMAQKEFKFKQLLQAIMSVAEYAGKFKDIADYSS